MHNRSSSTHRIAERTAIAAMDCPMHGILTGTRCRQLILASALASPRGAARQRRICVRRPCRPRWTRRRSPAEAGADYVIRVARDKARGRRRSAMPGRAPSSSRPTRPSSIDSRDPGQASRTTRTRHACCDAVGHGPRGADGRGRARPTTASSVESCTTRVHFLPLSSAEIAWYIARRARRKGGRLRDSGPRGPLRRLDRRFLVERGRAAGGDGQPPAEGAGCVD